MGTGVVVMNDWFWLAGTGVALMSELVGQVRSGVVSTSDRLWLTGTGVALMNEWV